MQNQIIDIKHVTMHLGDQVVHDDLNLTIHKGEIIGIVGGSGSGKTTLLREMLALITPHAGSIRFFEKEMIHASDETLLSIQKRLGVLFQQNALFSSLTVLENVSFPLQEHTALDEKTIRDLALLKIKLAGLPEEAAYKYPAELSGGMQKRAGIARAIALDPEVLFLDEPTTGLDPATASAFDELILTLQKTMNLSVVIVTHDLDTLWHITHRVAFLGEKKVLRVAPMKELMVDDHPLIQAFFSGPRGRAARSSNV